MIGGMKHLTWLIVAVLVAACGQDDLEKHADQGAVSADMSRFFADIAGLSNTAGNNPLVQVDPSCKPVCQNRVCGSDGCGGVCGTCDTGNDVACMANRCTSEGQCEMRFHREGIGCDDTDPCTIGDTCRVGNCIGVDKDTCGGTLKSCPLTGSAGDVVSCALYLAKQSNEVASAAGMNTRFLYDADQVQLKQFSCPVQLPNSNETIDTCDISQGSTLPPAIVGGPGHAILTNPQHPSDWNGNVKAVIFGGGAATALTSAHILESGDMDGDPQLIRLVFALKNDIPEDQPVFVEVTELDLSDGEGNTLKASLTNGVIVTQ